MSLLDLLVEDTECPCGKSTQNFITDHGHCKVIKLHCLPNIWPILKAALLIQHLKVFTYYCRISSNYHSILYEVREHDYSSTLSVMDELPHVPSRGLHGALSYDVGLLLLVALHMVPTLRA